MVLLSKKQPYTCFRRSWWFWCFHVCSRQLNFSPPSFSISVPLHLKLWLPVLLLVHVSRYNIAYSKLMRMCTQVKESKWLVKCFLNYLRHGKPELTVLFDILTIFLYHSRIDYTFLKEFYIIEVCQFFQVSLMSIALFFTSFRVIKSKWFPSLLPGFRRLPTQHEKVNSLAFSQPFSI